MTAGQNWPTSDTSGRSDAMTASDAWLAGVERAEGDLAAYRAELARQAATVPVTYTSAVCSILASPRLLDWPEPVREWLWAKATRWPRGMEDPHHAISRDTLGLR